jgi:hypothetical protein
MVVSTKMAVFWVIYHCVVWQKFTNVSEVLAASIIRAMLEAARTSETLVNFYQNTRRYNPEDTNLRNTKFSVTLLTAEAANVAECRHMNSPSPRSGPGDSAAVGEGGPTPSSSEELLLVSCC